MNILASGQEKHWIYFKVMSRLFASKADISSSKAEVADCGLDSELNATRQTT